ncbi:diguanylate cyclase [Amorphoplanes nipponensis]|uniref:Diguanylate cyclase n=1 Tax=Actinoplanes nipponensis TaxID=135950 RepID=A0A919JMW8_9ACTN|nr:GGDEF domain-containing phosphodiesterase [Actinoplanes nipponensis]GIE53728.1 diguanylate cyclase [Actinoplanes nipponensis]
MNLDDIIELAAARQPSALDRARGRRAAERVLREYAEATAEGRNLLGDLDVEDVLAPHVDEAARIRRTAESAQAGWVQWDAATGGLTWSDEMSRLFGYPAVATHVARDVLLNGIHPDDRDRVRQAVERGWTRRAPTDVTFRLLRADGTVRYVQCLVELLSPDGRNPTGIIATGHDVTRRELDRQQHTRRLRRDRLNGADHGHRPVAQCPVDRETFLRMVDRAAGSGPGALLVITVEPAGSLPAGRADQVTRTVAGVLSRVVPDTDFAGMLSPAEFGVFFHDLETATAQATSVHHQLTLTTAGGVRLRARSGLVACTGEVPVSGHDLLLDAMWAGREGHRGRPSALSVLAGPRSARARTDAVRMEVGAAIRSGRLRLHAQPILDLALNEINRYEILLRVLDEADRPQPPATFLAMAERGADIVAVDRWVVRQSLAVIGSGPQTAHYQINLSGRTLSAPGLADFVLRALDEHEVDPRMITFEVTESAAIGDLPAAVVFAQAVRRRGCELALDDFGTGYSSLSVLRRLPVDQLKIDGSFVTGLTRSPFDRITVQAVVGMCQALGIRTAAESAEDAATVELLRTIGVDFVQGYAVARPRPLPVPIVAPRRDGPAFLDRATG